MRVIQTTTVDPQWETGSGRRYHAQSPMSFCAALMALPLCVVAAPAAQAQQAIKLTIIDGYPPRGAVGEGADRLFHAGSEQAARQTATNTRSIGSRPSAARSPSRAASWTPSRTSSATSAWSPPCSTQANCRSTTCPITRRSRPATLYLVGKVIDEFDRQISGLPEAVRRPEPDPAHQYSSPSTITASSPRMKSKVSTTSRVSSSTRRDRTRFTSSQSAPSASLGSLLSVRQPSQNRRRPTAAIIWPEATITFKIGEVAPNYLETDFGTGVNKAITSQH